LKQKKTPPSQGLNGSGNPVLGFKTPVSLAVGTAGTSWTLFAFILAEFIESWRLRDVGGGVCGGVRSLGCFFEAVKIVSAWSRKSNSNIATSDLLQCCKREWEKELGFENATEDVNNLLPFAHSS
jgi:hypothetical protein